MPMLTYDLSVIPFSLPGSFLTITSRPAGDGSSHPHRLLYRTCSRQAITEKYMPFSASDFFEIALIRENVEIPYTWIGQPHRLDLKPEVGGSAIIAFADPHTLVFETKGVTLRLVPCKSFATEYAPGTSEICLVDSPARGIHHFRGGTQTEVVTTLVDNPAGSLHEFKDRPRVVDFIGTKGAIRFEKYESLWHGKIPRLPEVLHDREKDYSRWVKHLPVVHDPYKTAAEQAWFLLWNCQVSAEGALTRPAIYMSKFWMNAIWAWDNCFNALAVAEADPELAWNQLLLFFDHQDPNGMIPDMIHDQDAIYCFNKPPIYGWTIRKLVAKIGLKASRPYLDQLYKPVNHLTEWWYTMRDFDGDGMCQYHHGNDSGWDNATLFDQGYPTEGADLAAHLCLQSEGLSYMARAIGKKVASLRWKKRAEHQLADLLAQGVKNGRFFSPLDGKTDAPETQSLLNYIPIVLGRRLPKKIRKTLVADLGPGGPFLTEWGLATESPSSSKYEPDGYWRGPIWAPSTYLIFDGLVAAGERKLATLIARRFCNLCAQDSGFWENYDALTGKGLRCPGYTWTASVFLLLAGWLQENG
jgi:putative isomerase